MKLYYKPGACSMASHIVLIELNTPYTLELTDTAKGVTESGQNYAGINPKGYVPALELEPGLVLTENPAILEYLADLAPAGALAPKQGSLERVRMREWLAYLASELHKAYGPFFSGTELTAGQRNEAEARIARRLSPVEAQLTATGAYLLGDQLSVADIYAFVILNWSQFIGFSLNRWPATLAFHQRLGTQPSVVKALQEEGLIPSEESL